MLPAFLATVLFSLSVVFANRTTRMLGGTTANFYRLCVSTALLAIWAHAFGNGFGGGAFWVFFVSGVIGFGIGDLALYQALPRLGPRLSAVMVHCLAAPFAALTEWLWIGTPLTLAQIVAGTIILIGVAVALAPQEHLHIAPKILIAGIVFGIVAAIGQGGGAVVSRKAYAVAKAAGHDVVGLTFGLTAAYQRILGGLIFAALPSLWIIRRRRTKARPSEPGSEICAGVPKEKFPVWLWVLLNALAGPTLGVGCYQWALATTGSGVVLPIVATTPIVVIPLAYWLDGDRPGLRSIAGGLIAVAGAIGLTLAR
ncbi:MAG TPA: DMT family transporter [Verrucomicrobiae bacterium]|nr:DMT family transporter [Verrucomicrobiae bacterium]